MNKIRFFVLLNYLCLIPSFGSTWYVHPSGLDGLSDGNGLSKEVPLKTIGYAFNQAAEPGDTILILEGIYYNQNYGSGATDNPPVAYLNNAGEQDRRIVLKNYPGDTVQIIFDGAGGIIANELSYVEISGLIIQGPNQDISLDSALANRLTIPKPNYYNGRGIAIWGQTHHIKISNNKIFDCPASAIRVNKGDYITITHNEVYNNTWYTSSAESAIVFAESQSIDTKDTIKMILSHNIVHNNYNQIPFYTTNPPDVGIENYGTEEQDYIIDGSGVYITRNKTYDYGWYYLANNISYHNGINGVVVHRTDRAIVVHNTAFMNGKVSLSMGRQNASGITFNEAQDVYVFNNISWARYDTDYALKKYGDVTILGMDANIVGNGLSDYTQGVLFADPLFSDTSTMDLSLAENSPAIDAGVYNEYIPEDDCFGNFRDASPDIGALEWKMLSPVPDYTQSNLIRNSYPNPFQDHLFLSFSCDGDKVIRLYSIDGMIKLQKQTSFQSIELNTKQLNPGLYILHVECDKGAEKLTMIKKIDAN